MAEQDPDRSGIQLADHEGGRLRVFWSRSAKRLIVWVGSTNWRALSGHTLSTAQSQALARFLAGEMARSESEIDLEDPDDGGATLRAAWSRSGRRLVVTGTSTGGAQNEVELHPDQVDALARYLADSGPRT
jgi:hypothetical protein